MIFDTETTSLDKPFCYNVGYQIVDAESEKVLVARDYVVEQVWHNLPLFSSAYYADKRPIYVARMRSRQVIMDKFGYICRQMARDIRNYNVEHAYAYNSSFDEKVFNFNCDWYKCNNPFDTIQIHDIRGYAHHFICDDDYRAYCEENDLYTESGNYSSTAEAVYRFISGDDDFNEEHTALNDSIIETFILMHALNLGADITMDYKTHRSLERKIQRTLHIRTAEQTDYYFDYEKIRINREKTEVTLK
jgi:hypothetical protein